MGRIILNKEMQTKLNGLGQILEFCDESGKILGTFLPFQDTALIQMPNSEEKIERRRAAYEEAEAACPYSPEELQRFRQEMGGQSLADFWKSLGQT
jgi:hypothetical protein